MDIHKPKPWHGWREFLKEYVIIVVGVLTALGAEQGVERLHVLGEVSEARAALHAEISRQMRSLTLEAQENACWPAKLDAFEAWARGEAPKPKPQGALMQSLSETAWETARTGAVTHMGLEERLALANFYDGIENQRPQIHEVRLKSVALRGYLEREALDPEEAHALIRLIGETRGNVSGETRNVSGMLDRARKLGVEPAPPVPEYEARVDDFCAAFPPKSAEGR